MNRLPPGPRACRRCGVVKPLDQFSPNPRVSNGRGSQCRSCDTAKAREYRRNNPEARRRELARMERNRQANMRRLHDYLAEHPCVDCGETDPIVLEFDHVRGVKKAAIGSSINRSWAALVAEIAKCEVRCANCHRRKTASQFGWYAYLKEPAS